MCQCVLVCLQDKSKLVMFEAAKRYMRSVDESVWEAFTVLAQHGGVEGEHELSTILMERDERVRSVFRCMQLKWLHGQHVPEEEVAMD